jgi:hypothetical protein
MDIDLGGLWSWTVPLWGLFAIVFILGGVLTTPVKLVSLEKVMAPSSMAGGGTKVGKKTRA